MTGQCFLDFGFSRWGWTIGPLSADSSATHIYDIYAGAGQCDISKGTKVGTLEVTFDGSQAQVTYNADGVNGFGFDQTHTYVGCNKFPTDENGVETVAPGQYTVVNDSPLSNAYKDFVAIDITEGCDVYVMAHAVACADDWPTPAPVTPVPTTVAPTAAPVPCIEVNKLSKKLVNSVIRILAQNISSLQLLKM